MSNILSLSVPVGSIRAALLCAPRKPDIRYYLNGVCLETGPKGARIAGTDGHRLFGHRFSDEEFPVSKSIIPSELFSGIRWGKAEFFRIEIEGLEVRIEVAPDTRKFGHVIDGTFPDVSKVIPAKASGKLAQFDPEYVADFGKVAKFLGNPGGRIFIHHNGKDGALVRFEGGGEAFGILMPLFRVEDRFEAPAWGPL